VKLLEPEFEHSDSRRTLTQLFTAPINQVNFYNAKKGAILGDHFHKETIEYFYVTKGTLLYNNERVINRGTTFVVEPQENHILECLTDVQLMTFLTKPFDKEKPDLWKK